MCFIVFNIIANKNIILLCDVLEGIFILVIVFHQIAYDVILFSPDS